MQHGTKVRTVRSYQGISDGLEILQSPDIGYHEEMVTGTQPLTGLQAQEVQVALVYQLERTYSLTQAVDQGRYSSLRLLS